MKKLSRHILAATLILSMLPSLAWQTLPVEIQRDEAVLDYPRKITFELQAQSEREIVKAELSFGTDALSCADSTTHALPEDFTPGREVTTSLEWNLLQRGAVPPGTHVWWQWTLTDAEGQTFTAPRQEVEFNNPALRWLEARSEHLTVLWLEGPASFGETLVGHGESVTRQLETELCMDVLPGMEIYIFPNSRAMQENSLYLPDWSGGVAFPDFRRMMAGVGPTEHDWGRLVVRHELVHVIVGQYTFSCFDSTPPWVDEGLATYFEGPFRSDQEFRLSRAIAADTLFSVRELGFGFSDDATLAIQAYAQSRSLIEYLLKNYDSHLMLALLDEFRDGVNTSQALERVYGLSQDQLDADWRAWVGAPPREDAPSGEPTPTRTAVPTFAPISGVGGPTATLEPTPTLEPSPTTPPPATSAPAATATPEPEPAAATPGAPLLVGGLAALVVLALVVGFIIRRKS